MNMFSPRDGKTTLAAIVGLASLISASSEFRWPARRCFFLTLLIGVFFLSQVLRRTGQEGLYVECVSISLVIYLVVAIRLWSSGNRWTACGTPKSFMSILDGADYRQYQGGRHKKVVNR